MGNPLLLSHKMQQKGFVYGMIWLGSMTVLTASTHPIMVGGGLSWINAVIAICGCIAGVYSIMKSFK